MHNIAPDTTIDRPDQEQTQSFIDKYKVLKTPCTCGEKMGERDELGLYYCIRGHSQQPDPIEFNDYQEQKI